MKLKQLTVNALLTAIALTIFMIEAQIPAPVPIPGIKLGLANIITVFAMFAYTPKDALSILLVRVFLGSVFSGQISTILYSLAGGLLCFVVTAFLQKILTFDQIWVASVIGAIFHNLGQTLMAMVITGTLGLAVYFPMLMVSGVVTGVFTGLCTQVLYHKLHKFGVF